MSAPFGVDTFKIPLFLKEGDGIDLEQAGGDNRTLTVNSSFVSIKKYGVKGDGGDDTDAMNTLIALINAGTAGGTIVVPSNFDIAVTAPLADVLKGGWHFYCAGGPRAIFRLKAGSGSHGRIFRLGDATHKVGDWGFTGIIFQNDNDATDTGTEWAIEPFSATKGILEHVDLNNGLAIKHGSGLFNGGSLVMQDVSINANKALPNPAVNWVHANQISGTVFTGAATSRNLLSNSNFNNDTAWTFGAGWTRNPITNVVDCVGVALSPLSQPITVLAGWAYDITFTISNFTGGAVIAGFTGGTPSSGIGIGADGTYTQTITANTGNNTFMFLANAGSTFSVDTVTVKRATHANFRFERIGPEVLGGNIDSLTFIRSPINPRDFDVPSILEIDCSWDDVGTLNFNTCFFELPLTRCILIHSLYGSTGFARNINFTDCRATPSLIDDCTAIEIDNLNNVEMRGIQWNDGQISSTKGPAVKISSADPAIPIGVSFNSASCLDRALGLGSPHHFFEIASPGVRIEGCTLQIQYNTDGSIPSVMVDEFIQYTENIASAIVTNNDFRLATAAEAIDISLVTSLASGGNYNIGRNLGPTRVWVSPDGVFVLSPSDAPFFAKMDGTTSDTAALNALFDYVRILSTTTPLAIPIVVDLSGGTIYVGGDGIDVTAISLPLNVRIQNGSIIGACTGNAVFDLAGSRNLLIENVFIHGDTTNIPSSAFQMGRLSTGAASDGHIFFNCGSDGYFSKPAYFNSGSEGNTILHCNFRNSNSTVTSSTYAGAIQAEHIIPMTSQFQTLQTTLRSCIQFTIIDTEFRCAPADSLTITGISKANPAVITYTGTAPANGSKYRISTTVVGMVEIRGAEVTVANVGASTFECSGLDSSAYTTYTSGGTASRATAPALMLHGISQLRALSSYAVAYNSRCIDVNLTTGSFNNNEFDIHCEGVHDYTYNWLNGDAAQTVRDITIRDHTIHSTKGWHKTDNTLGSIILDGVDLRLVAPQVNWTVGMFSNPERFSLNGFKIAGARGADLPAIPGTFIAANGGETLAHDRTPKILSYVQRGTYTDTTGALTIPELDFTVTTQSLTTAAATEAAAIIITNVNVKAGDPIYVNWRGGTSTGGIGYARAFVSDAEIRLFPTNVGTSAANGTWIFNVKVERSS